MSFRVSWISRACLTLALVSPAVAQSTDLALLGTSIHTQALLNNVGDRAQLTNAWDLVLGL